MSKYIAVERAAYDGFVRIFVGLLSLAFHVEEYEDDMPDEVLERLDAAKATWSEHTVIPWDREPA